MNASKTRPFMPILFALNSGFGQFQVKINVTLNILYKNKQIFLPDC